MVPLGFARRGGAPLRWDTPQDQRRSAASLRQRGPEPPRCPFMLHRLFGTALLIVALLAARAALSAETDLFVDHIRLDGTTGAHTGLALQLRPGSTLEDVEVGPDGYVYVLSWQLV